MEEVIRFALLGLGLGALYSLAAFGLIAVYRGSGVLNFAHGAIGMVGAYVAWEVRVEQGLPFGVALVVGILASAVLGALTYALIMRPLRRASPIARTVATLGVLIVLQSAAVLRYGNDTTFVENELPADVLRLFGDVVISADRIVLLAIAAALCLGLWALYRFTMFGRATSAVAENERAAAALGRSSDRIAALNWALGSALAGLAAILVSPIVTLQAMSMTTLVLAAMAAALIAGFRSFPVAFAAGMLVGILQTEADRFVDQPGFARSVPFVLIVIVMLVRGRDLPLRDFFLQRLPSVGTGRVRPVPVLIAIAVAVALILTLKTSWVDGLVMTFGVACVLLSIVVLTGYTGQLSLAQFALAGFGAWVASTLVAAAGLPFWLAVLLGVLATVPLGVLFALPAVRSRGIQLAIVTLGLGTAIQLMLFNNGDYTGGFQGTEVGTPTLFGLEIDAVGHPERYALFALACFVVCALVAANLRRGRTGRRLLAVRTNERAAAALGIGVRAAKLYAFGVSAAFAALGGILIAFRDSSIFFTQFDALKSITAVGFAVIGGVGYLAGPLIGGTLAPGAIGTNISDAIFSGVAQYLELISGAILILLVLQNQDGMAREAIGQLRWVGTKIGGLVGRTRAPVAPTRLPPASGVRDRMAPKRLEVEGLTVRFGRTTAVDDVSLAVEPGRIVGLIGPNGAGKTTFIDGVTGFVAPAAGAIRLDGQVIDQWDVARRSQAGLSRSFQSLELFEDLTVLDNLRAASDPRDGLSYLRDLVYPVAAPLPGPVLAAIEEFGLAGDLDEVVENLSYGKRRLLAIARAVATGPSVLLLDEPAAGLGSAETAELGQLVRRLAADWGMGILVIEHDVTFVMSTCDEIVVLDFGATIAAGPPEDVRNDPAVISAYLGGDATAEPTAQPTPQPTSEPTAATAGRDD
ncbi:ABC transporter permease subunit [Pseudonocardia lacus]|uniref:ABC transporter permease subunit n=1 Tax=Pseudonocardia lacus TaxID=2835865 RepID=UPI002028E779|nr:ATP-binding cassette domain-containing protein [Pseudonocardia lacus]